MFLKKYYIFDTDIVYYTQILYIIFCVLNYINTQIMMGEKSQ